MRKALASVVMLLASSLCEGAGLFPDPTGLWFDPTESGWGMDVTQQGDTLFVVLFVYDEARRPAWYVASDLRLNPDFGPVPNYIGTLYRTMGPWFGGGFDPHSVNVTAVGNIALQDATGQPGSLRVDYTIDGLHVTKTVQPQTWGDNRALLPGNYEGGLVITDRSPFGTCVPVSFGPFDSSRAFRFAVSDSAGGNPLHIVWGTGIDTACTIDGDYTQHGQLGSLSGTMACGPIGTPTVAHAVQLTDLAIGPHGFSGMATVVIGSSCLYTGHVGGVRLPN